VPGGASVETWDLCLEQDFLYANLSYFGYKEGQKVMDGFWNRVDELGHERNPYRAGFLQFIAIADNDAQAQELYEQHARYFWQRCLHVYGGFVNPPGYTSLDTIRAGIKGQVARIVRRAGARADLATLGWKDFVERGYLVCRRLLEVDERLAEATDKLNVGHLMVLCQFGDMPKDKAIENTRRFAEEVAPLLRGRFANFEDRWSPRRGAHTSGEA